MKFRKKPLVVEAMPIGEINRLYFEKCSISDTPDWVQNLINEHKITFALNGMFIKVYGNHVSADLNDWLVLDQNGEPYPCKPDIFEKTYEKVEE